ncbi:hypothetical protein DE146DRAFT_152601 [Phaeosphaeria sp. MPI-PUGE-AT-0046c]|nr:hypothetical protein DE146DRAFT_152601 [Phaeosphaeria sp. MPI-PUGE-AT-0046c]
MDIFRSKPSTAHESLDGERPAKRISTPAGQRLSMIIESTQARRSKSPAPTKISVTTTSTYCNDPTHQHIDPVQHGHKNPKKLGVVSVLTGGKLSTPRESSEEQPTPNGSALSVSVWSDKDGEKFGHIRHNKSGGIRNWSRRRIAIIGAILLVVIIALAVGLAVGLKKKPASSTSPSTSGDSTPAGSQGSQTTRPASEPDKPATLTDAIAPTAVPSAFPVGTYSFVTFLDTVQSGCTANEATWTCAPNTNYYSDPQKALTVLNWEISGTAGSYKISSKGRDATFGTMFQNERLELLDSGKDTERYRFSITRTKSVNMTGSIGEQKGDFSCDYGNTNIQGSLYTKMARSYPKDTIAVGDTGNPAWPYAVRVEQTVAGGDNVPSCKRSSGEKVSESLKAQDAGTLCSCLYKNWTPARPGS